MSNNHPLSYWIARNEQKVCKVCGNRKRWRISGMCNRCSRIHNYFGDGRAEPIHRGEYQAERQEVRDLLELNGNHPGIVKALEFCQSMIEKAAKGLPQVDGADHLLSIVADRGATGEEVFVEVAALHVLYYRNDRRIKSKTHLRNLVGVRVLRLKKSNGHLTGKTNRSVGHYLTDGIGPVLLINLARAIDRRAEMKNDWLKKQGEELRIC